MLFLLGSRCANCICVLGGRDGFEFRSFAFVSIVSELGLIIGKGLRFREEKRVASVAYA